MSAELQSRTITCGLENVSIDVTLPPEVELTHCPVCGRGLDQ